MLNTIMMDAQCNAGVLFSFVLLQVRIYQRMEVKPMRNKFVNILASVAMVFGSSGVSVYAEETPAPTGSPAVTETTPASDATPSASESTAPEASVTPEASPSVPVRRAPSATPESTPAASAEPTPEISPAVPPQPIEDSPWLSDWSYKADSDTSTVTLYAYLPEPGTVDGHPDTSWSVDVTVPASAEIDGTEYTVALASQIITASTMVPVHSISFEDGVKLQPDSSKLFASFNATMIHASGLDLTGVTKMDYAFSGTNLRTLDLSGLDFSGIADVSTLVANDNYSSSYIISPAKFADGATCQLPTYARGATATAASPVSFYAMSADGTVDESVEYTDLAKAPANTKLVRRMPIVLWIGGETLDSYNTAMASATDAASAYAAFSDSMGTGIPAGTYHFGLYNSTDVSDLGDPVETMAITVADDGTATYTLTRDGVTSEAKDCDIRLSGGDCDMLPRFERHYDCNNSVVLMLDPDGNPLTEHLASYEENGKIIHFVNDTASYGKISGTAGFVEDSRGQAEYGSNIGIAYEPYTAVTITYDPGYDGATAATENTTQGASINLMDHALTREGYVFLGWNDGSASYLYSDTYTVPADTHAVTLTGQWAPINVNAMLTVNYKVTGGNESASVLALPLNANDEAMPSDDGGIASGSDSTTARISISANALGTTTYTVTPGTPNLVDYALDSADTHTVAVTVDNNGGTLNVFAVVDGGETQYVQSFKIVNNDGVLGLATVDVNPVNAGTYTLHHVDPTNAADTLAAQVNLDNAPSAGAQVVVNDKDVKTSDDNGAASYEYSHAEGTHTYTIRQNLTAEQKADKNMRYDETVYTVTYTTHRASSDETAADYLTLVSDPVIKTDAGYVTDRIVFNNYTVPADPSDVSLTGTVMFDNAFHKIDSFPFEILDENGKQIERVDSIDGGFKFSNLHYDKVGTHTYTVQQILGSDETINYDASVYAVTVATKKGSVDGKNTYISTVTLKKDGKDANEIRFANTTKTAEPLTVSEVANGDNGSKIRFNDDVRTVKDGKATHNETFKDVGTYTVVVRQELTDEQLIDENWNYDRSVYTITYTVTRDGNSLSETHVITDSEGNVVDEIVFHNTKNDPKPSWTVLSGTVTIDNDKRVKQGLPEIDSFKIQLLNEDGNVIQTVNSRDGKFAFSPIQYFAEGTHNYTVKQLAGDDPTVEYSDVVYTVTLDTRLRDNTPKLNEYYDAISINASIHGQQPAGAEFIQFANITYEPNPVNVTLGGIVHRNGEVPNLETYQFVASHDNVALAADSVKDLVTFDAQKLTAPGTYTFRLSQIPGSLASMRYDDAVYTAVITVTRNVNDLEYSVVYKDAKGNEVDLPVWNNISNAFAGVKPLTYSIAGKVKLNDGDPTCSCFDFTLSEQNTRSVTTLSGAESYTAWSDTIDPNEVALLAGVKSAKADAAYRKDSVVQAVKNDGGKFGFANVTLDHEGTYTFTVREVKGNNANIEYDTGTVYTVTLKVSRDWKTGAYKIDSEEIRKNGTITSEGIIFTNRTKIAYTPSKATAAPTVKPTATPAATPSAAQQNASGTTNDNPKSGDNGYAGYIPGAIITAAGIIVLLVLKRKNAKTAE